MRKQRRSASRTANWRSDTGSIALEASLVLPIVLMVVLFFICIIRLNTVQMALHGAVSQTVRQAATNMHPIELALQQMSGAGDVEPDGSIPSSNPDSMESQKEKHPTEQPLPAVRFVADRLEGWLPSPSGELLAAALTGDWEKLQDAAAAEACRAMIEPIVRQLSDQSVLEPDRLHVTKLVLPDLKDKNEPFLALEAEYSFSLGFPFTKGAIVLKERAEERVWVADPVPARRGGEAADADRQPIQIVLIEPSPVRPGLKARVVVKTNAGRSLSIKVLYKSGRSIARNLGDVVTDNSGFAEWTWHVSGNTTPGTWELVVTASDGMSAARHFVVEKKAER